MTLEGAINLSETTDYIICTMNSVSTGQYGLVMPKNINGVLNVLVDLHMKGSFDEVSNSIKTKEQLVQEISSEYDQLKSKYAECMLVLPMTDEGMFKNTVATGDKQKMFDEVKKIGAITSELYKKLTDSGMDKQKIDQKIIIVEKNSDDEKFVEWLKEQMPNFVDGFFLNQSSANTQDIVNPFIDSNSIFGSISVASEESKKDNVSPTTSASVSNGSVFDNSAPVHPVTPVAPIEAVNSTVESTPVTPVEPVVFSAPVESVSVETTVNSIPNSGVDLFGAPMGATSNSGNNNSVNVASAVNTGASVLVQEPVVSDPALGVESVGEVPKPVQSAMLEGTAAFSPILNPTNEAQSNQEEVNVTGNASKGFANLLILLVILVGVTLASIELGKFLYSVYGA